MRGLGIVDGADSWFDTKRAKGEKAKAWADSRHISSLFAIFPHKLCVSYLNNYQFLQKRLQWGLPVPLLAQKKS